MRLTRAISVCALGLAILLAIGAVTPYQPLASAHPDPIFIIQTAQPAMPTPALAFAAPVEQPAAAPVEQPAAAPVEQLAAAPVEQPAAAPVEQLAAAPVEPLPAAPVEQQPAAQVEPLPAAAYVYQSEQLHNLSLDASAAPACDPGIEDSYCSLPIGQLAPAPASAYQPMTDRQRRQSEARTR